MQVLTWFWSSTIFELQRCKPFVFYDRGSK